MFTDALWRYIRGVVEKITVEPVLFLYMLSIFSQYALFQDLVYGKVCSSNFEEGICDNLHLAHNSAELDSVQASSSHWILLATLSTGIPAVFMAVYLGSWSDRFGRKWPVAIPPLGGILGCIVYIVIAFVPESPIGLICFASFLPGITGGFVSCIMSCMTYVSSVTTDKDRTVRIFRLEAMIYLGGTIGPFISGSILEYIGHGYSFVLMLLCYTSAVLYTALFVKDTNSEDPLSFENPTEKNHNANRAVNDKYSSTTHNRHSPSPPKSLCESDDENKQFIKETAKGFDGESRTSCCSKYFSPDHFLSAIQTCCKNRDGYKRFYILAVITAGFMAMVITSGELDVAYLFARDKPLVWTYQTYAYYLGYKFGLGSFSLLVLMPLLQRLQFEDTTICLLGLVSRVAGLVCFGLSESTYIAFLAPIVSICSFFTIPSVRSLLSKLVHSDEQGKMFAFIAIAEDICSLTASVLFNTIYPLTRTLFRGFIFQAAAVSLVVPIFIILCVRKGLTAETKMTETKTEVVPIVAQSSD